MPLQQLQIMGLKSFFALQSRQEDWRQRISTSNFCSGKGRIKRIVASPPIIHTPMFDSHLDFQLSLPPTPPLPTLLSTTRSFARTKRRNQSWCATLRFCNVCTQRYADFSPKIFSRLFFSKFFISVLIVLDDYANKWAHVFCFACSIVLVRCFVCRFPGRSGCISFP